MGEGPDLNAVAVLLASLGIALAILATATVMQIGRAHV